MTIRKFDAIPFAGGSRGLIHPFKEGVAPNASSGLILEVEVDRSFGDGEIETHAWLKSSDGMRIALFPDFGTLDRFCAGWIGAIRADLGRTIDVSGTMTWYSEARLASAEDDESDMAVDDAVGCESVRIENDRGVVSMNFASDRNPRMDFASSRDPRDRAATIIGVQAPMDMEVATAVASRFDEIRQWRDERIHALRIEKAAQSANPVSDVADATIRAGDIEKGHVLIDADGASTVIATAVGTVRTALFTSDGDVRIHEVGDELTVGGRMDPDVETYPMPEGENDFEVVDGSGFFVVVPWIEDGERQGFAMTQVVDGNLSVVRHFRDGSGLFDDLAIAVREVRENYRHPGVEIASVEPGILSAPSQAPTP